MILLLFDYFDLVELQIHRSLAAEHGDHHADAVLLGLQLLHNAEEACERPVNDLDLIADGVADDDLPALHAEIVDLLLREGDGLAVGPDEPRTLWTRCQLSSVRIILTSTYPGKTLRSTVFSPASVISVTVSIGMLTSLIRSVILRFSAAFITAAATAFSYPE